MLRLTRDLDTDFLCKYNMAMYPFDTQTCHMEFLLPVVENDFCSLENDGLFYGGTFLIAQVEQTKKMIKESWQSNLDVNVIKKLTTV